MTGITAQQSKLLTFIGIWQHDYGISPSYGQMAEYMGLRSKSGILRLLTGLEERGRIKRIHRRARSIEIVRKSCPHCGGAL